ncbi:hypothetical protein IEQ34_019732 [Dendrobium chrysotoxum]|uniref:Uncharacterized protein n=1 Tax=Dendrobium chrysotoxum TaxID=161865 RepID=A0AAV7GAR7_DENCH|nr:hypothetical protein IEQ34_019732 [Dendrobium chrysotoxum]
MTLNIDIPAEEPLRQKLVGLFPNGGIPLDGERVDEDACAGADVVAVDDDVLAGLARDEQWHYRVQPQRLLHDSFYVREVLRVLLLHPPLPADDTVKLLCCLPHDLWLPQKLRHCPLHRHRGGLCSARD